jgi:hypothetical protein
MPTYNYGNNIHEQGFIKPKIKYKEQLDYPGYVPSIKTRFFKRGTPIQFKGCWHELLDYDIHAKRIPCSYVELPIHHYNTEICQSSMTEKMNFYLRLGEKKTRENPNDPQAWWELGVSESIAGLRTRAEYSICKSVALGFYDHKRMFTLARLFKMNKNPTMAKIAFEKAMCKLYPSLTHINSNLKTNKIFTESSACN